MSIVKQTPPGENFLEKVKTEGDAPYISGLQLYQKNVGSDGASGNTVFTLNEPYSPGSNTLFVFLNGQKCDNTSVPPTLATEYEETDPYTVTFGASLLNNDLVEFIVIGAYVLDAEEAANILGIITGTKMYFYQAAAPLGWTIDATLGDSVLAVHGSSSYAGSGSGGVQAGTWTQPNHTHSFDDGGHVHTGTTNTETVLGPNIATDGSNSHYHTFTTDSANATGTTGGGATANTWRPKANVGIIATRN